MNSSKWLWQYVLHAAVAEKSGLICHMRSSCIMTITKLTSCHVHSSHFMTIPNPQAATCVCPASWPFLNPQAATCVRPATRPLLNSHAVVCARPASWPLLNSSLVFYFSSQIPPPSHTLRAHRHRHRRRRRRRLLVSSCCSCFFCHVTPQLNIAERGVCIHHDVQCASRC